MRAHPPFHWSKKAEKWLRKISRQSLALSPSSAYSNQEFISPRQEWRASLRKGAHGTTTRISLRKGTFKRCKMGVQSSGPPLQEWSRILGSAIRERDTTVELWHSGPMIHGVWHVWKWNIYPNLAIRNHDLWGTLVTIHYAKANPYVFVCVIDFILSLCEWMCSGGNWRLKNRLKIDVLVGGKTTYI